MNEWLSSDLWHQTLQSVVQWLVRVLPSVLLVVVVVFVAFRMLHFGLARLKQLMMIRSRRPGRTDVGEVEKRVDTLVGREYRRRLKKAFDERDIEIPFPHHTVYWGEASRPFELLTQSREADAAKAAS